MKKILSFLALLLVAFALPTKVMASWGFSSNPSTIEIYLEDQQTGIQMTYSGSQWTAQFTAARTTEQFKLHLNNSSDHWYGYTDGKVSASSSSWTEIWTNSNTGKFSFTNLTAGKTYKVTLVGNSGKDSCNMKIEEVDSTPSTLYLYDTDPLTKIGTATPDANGVFTFTVDLTDSDYFVLSTVNSTSWDSVNSDRYNCSTTTTMVDGSSTSFIKTTDKAWKAGLTGTYTITVNWESQTLTTHVVEANTTPETLYLVTNGTAGTKSASIDSSDNTFTYSGVYFHAGNTMYLSTDAAGASGSNYGPSSSTDLVSGTSYSFDKVDSKNWVAPVDGTYDITVDWDNSTFTATWVETVPTDMHLFVNGELKNSAIIYGTTFTYDNIELEPGDQLILSTVANGTSGIYTPGSATTLVDSEWMPISYSDNGYWEAPVKGTYSITVDWSDKTLMATWVEVMPDAMYLFVGSTKVAPETAESGEFTYTVELTKGAQFVLSTDENNASGTKYTPGSATTLVYNEGSAFTNSDSGYWTAPVAGTYTISVSYSSKTLTATWEADFDPLYLYSNTPSWATKIATLNTKTGIYTAIVKLGEGTMFVLSTKDATGVDYNGLKNEIYTHGSGETTLSSGVASSFYNSNDGCWKAPASGEYTITIDWENKTLTATWTTPQKKVHMPLSEADFENGQKHYFIVGNRMGEWRLLPEWELKADANGDLVLNNRWFYPGGFAIGVVDNYDEYIKHTYTYYCTSCAFKDDVLSCTTDFSGNGVKWTATGTMSSPSNNFWTEFSSSLGGGDYWQATGTLVSEVKVGLNSSGLPNSLTMTVGDKATANKYRFFTLVGDDIYNSNFCNSYGPGTTLQKSKGQTSNNGWQEGWIQYDQVTSEPYVDGNYNYLYHTSYTPDYFQASPSLFNQTLSDGSTFSYTSNEAQFVEYTHLSDLDSDPYREFYQAFTGTQSIATGEVKQGNGYDFTVKTVNGDVTPSNDWSCYVVRDMWINGEIKIWTGWGGNDRRSGGSDVDGSVWHGENGGPATADLQVQGYDITSGLTATLYNNEKNIDDTNYKISDGEPVYFNRVILWYNIDEGIGNSFVQFIQESAGPAIFAQLAQNPNTSANNYIKYNWYLNAAQNDTDSDRKVVGYQILRYTYVDGVKTFIGYPEGEYVDITEQNVTVADLQQATAGNYSFTTFTDAGVDGHSGFAPGMYQYDIVVTFEDGATKNAVSNKVAIYGNNIITPSAYALQLVRLSDAGRAKLGDVSQEYLTYNPSVEGNWFVLDVEKIVVDEETTYGKPYNAELLDGATALEFMMNNQDKYDFTSNFYIRALDKKIYDSTFEEYMREGLVTDASIPTPNVTAFDGYEVTSQAYPFTLGDNEFYSAVLFREGNLENRTAQVTVNYTYTDANSKEVNESPINQTELMPVTPLPYNPSYSYEVVTYEVESGSDYIEVAAPKRGSSSFEVPTSVANAKVATSEGKLTTNMMVLNVTYNRPNVDAEILREYQIEENVTIDDEESYEETFWFYYADDKAANVEHIFSAEGVSPYNSSVPAVDFFQTRYLGKWIEVDGEQTVRFSDGPEGTFGNGIKFTAPHAIESVAGTGLSGVHLGVITREDGTYDWMYKGHESLGDKAPELVKTGATYENQATQTIAPNYYLYELSNGTNDMAYDFLVSHSACDHRDGDVTVDPTTGFVLNDEDPLIGTYVVKGFTKETIPAVYVSSIYLFSNPKLCLIDGELPTSNSGTLNTLAEELPTEDEMAAGNVGGMPDYGTDVASGTFEGWALKGQTYSNTPSEGNVTGVENVLAEGENGEAVYYNLQGIRVDNPSAAGVYVRVQGKDVKKVVVK